MPLEQLKPKNPLTSPTQEDICLFAQTTYRSQMRKFGIKVDDRRRHMYIIGKTGMGKTTMMENMVFHDIYSGHGVGVVDPHGDFAEKIINYIPPNRINDVVYFNPADIDFPIGFNILEVRSEEQKHLVAAGLMGIFKKIWPDVWSSRMEYILNNTILALLDYPGTTLLGINRLLAEKGYRQKVVRNLKDPVVKAFWQTEFASYSEKYAQEAVAPIQNKIGQFLSASVIRNMVAQVKSTINVRDIMDSQKIFIMNLSKGRIGEDNSRLLGGMLITELQLAAMARVDTPEADRKDFFLYVDEFQNFASPSFANILSEARKYRLSLIMAHQYVKQLDEVVGDAVFGNVGTIVTFRVGGADAEVLVKEFTPTFLEEDIVNLPKFQVLMKLMIDGVASQPFSAMTMRPIGSATGSMEKVIRVSRERYAKNRATIEDKIMRWSGMGEGGDGEDDDTAEDAPVTMPTLDKKDGEPSAVTPEKSIPAVSKNKEPKVAVKPPVPSVAPIQAPEQVVSLSSLLPPTTVGGIKDSDDEDVDEGAVDTSETKVVNVPAITPSSVVATSVGSADQPLTRSQKKRRRRNKNKPAAGGAPSTPTVPSPRPAVASTRPAVVSPPQLKPQAPSASIPPVDPIVPPPSIPPTPPANDTVRLTPNQVVRFDE